MTVDVQTDISHLWMASKSQRSMVKQALRHRRNAKQGSVQL